MAKDAEEHEDWAAVDRAVKARLRDVGMSLAQLARDTALSETTIRYIGEGGGTEAPLVAIAAVLDWPLDYLRNILHGESHKNVQAVPGTAESSESILEPHFRKLLRTELGPVKKDVAALRSIVDRIDKKIDVIIQGQDEDADGPR